MPAQKKVTREAIIKGAYEILRKNGIEAVNARSIAKKLGCSTQPIYHAFEGMEQLKAELVVAAQARHSAEVRRYMEKSQYTSYMAYGMGFVFLAKKEGQLFRFLFMTDHSEERMAHELANSSEILTLMNEEYGYSHEDAVALHEHMSVYACGLALGINTGMFHMTESEIAEHFKTEFAALTGVYGTPMKKKEKEENRGEKRENKK